MIDSRFLRGSDGTGPAPIARVNTQRINGATVFKVDTVNKWPSGAFIATVGQLNANGYLDPALGPINEFRGHLTSGDIILDSWEPGFSDPAGGTPVNSYVILKQTTGWANLVQDLVAELQNEFVLRDSEVVADFVRTGGIWSIVSGLNGAMTAATAYQAGYRGLASAIASRAFTPSKDTYVDLLRTTGIANTTSFSVVYTEVANGATAPALAANSIRIALVTTNGTNITKIKQKGYDTLLNRIRNDSPINPGQSSIFWEELDRDTVVAGTATQLTCRFPAKKYIRIMTVQHSGLTTLTSGIRLNNDTGTNYAYRTIENAAADSGNVSNQTWIQTGSNALEGSHASFELVNEANYRKVLQALETFWDTAGQIYRNTYAAYWQNNTQQVSRVDWTATLGAFQPGTELIILGHD